MPEITFTFKAGANYADPWVVVRADTVDEASEVLQDLRERGAFSAVKAVAGEFWQSPAAGVETAQEVLGAEVISEERAAPSTPTPPVEQSTPPCETCGGPTKFKNGTSPKTGAWAGYFCLTGEKSHTKFIN